MADMKTVIQAIDAATGKVKSVYKKLVDLGDGTYGEAATLTGSIPEYGWLNTDEPVIPDDPTKLAFGVEINTTTHTMATKYWTGSTWQEVL